MRAAGICVVTIFIVFVNLAMGILAPKLQVGNTTLLAEPGNASGLRKLLSCWLTKQLEIHVHSGAHSQRRQSLHH
jgi:hypothetical protein